ncbi:hypothetical protein [Capnocytophaga haemolytica]
MKTIFKVGMEVYDYTYGKGEIIEIQDYRYFDNTLLVKFENREALMKYSLDGRLINYKSCGGDLASENVATNPTLSTSPYTLQGFEQKSPVITFEEAWEEAEKIYEPKSEYNKKEYGGYPTQELADASEALRRLLFLRNYYNEGWRPNYKNKETKYTIYTWANTIICNNTFDNNRILCFETEEIRDKFFEEQKELLEIAKPLL